eukprot:TRINITY_DN4242_c0_g1_i1.p1 TRINITY_DN4242_c0_g1~~TRINITY_DN4242_c0_g1_i1.p1  ORF type:complete len:438 (+),score=156.94 TRINITY_DN4242_c0_g1_i1:63-1376(+)
MYLQQRRSTNDALVLGGGSPAPRGSAGKHPSGRLPPKGSPAPGPATPPPSTLTYVPSGGQVHGPKFGSRLVKFHQQAGKQQKHREHYYDEDKVKAAIDSNGLQLAVSMQRSSARTLAPIERSGFHQANSTPPGLPKVNSKPGAVKTIEEFVRHELGLLREDGEEEVSFATSPTPRPPSANSVEQQQQQQQDEPADAPGGNEGLSHRYQRLNVFRQAFHMFLSVVPAYSPVLEMIIAEYESFIRLLEGKLKTPGKERQEAYKQFEAELDLRQAHMNSCIAAKDEEVVQKQAKLRVREQEVEADLANITAENHHLQQEIARLHDQNLTLSHNIVDYRFQTQKVEQQMKECEQLERRYERLKAEHQHLLEELATEARENPDPNNVAARLISNTSGSGTPRGPPSGTPPTAPRGTRSSELLPHATPSLQPSPDTPATSGVT